jgi:hypothetical protein
MQVQIQLQPAEHPESGVCVCVHLSGRALIVVSSLLYHPDQTAL